MSINEDDVGKVVAYNPEDKHFVSISQEREPLTDELIVKCIKKQMNNESFVHLDQESLADLAQSIRDQKPPSKMKLKGIYKRVNELLDKYRYRYFETEDPKTSMVPCTYPDPTEKQNNRYYVVGPSGAGKSWTCARMLTVHKKLYPKAEIFLFTVHDNDPSLDDKIKNIQRIKLDDSFLKAYANKQPYKPADFAANEDSQNCILFDDIDNIPNLQIRKLVANLRDSCLTESRHHNCTIYTISHDVLGGLRTKSSIQNSTHIIAFPNMGAKSQIRRFLKIYMNLPEDTIDRMVDEKLNSRWIMVGKSSPPYCLYEHGLFLI